MVVHTGEKVTEGAKLSDSAARVGALGDVPELELGRIMVCLRTSHGLMIQVLT